MVDLREPRQIEVLTYAADGRQVGRIVLGDDEPAVSPEQAASMALHADGVVRAQIFSLEGDLLLDRAKDPDGHGYLDS